MKERSSSIFRRDSNAQESVQDFAGTMQSSETTAVPTPAPDAGPTVTQSDVVDNNNTTTVEI